MSSSRRPSFFHLSTWLPLPALALAALLLLAVEAVIVLPVAWDLLWAGALRG